MVKNVILIQFFCFFAVSVQPFSIKRDLKDLPPDQKLNGTPKYSIVRVYKNTDEEFDPKLSNALDRLLIELLPTHKQLDHNSGSIDSDIVRNILSESFKALQAFNKQYKKANARNPKDEFANEGKYGLENSFKDNRIVLEKDEKLTNEWSPKLMLRGSLANQRKEERLRQKMEEEEKLRQKKERLQSYKNTEATTLLRNPHKREKIYDDITEISSSEIDAIINELSDRSIENYMNFIEENSDIWPKETRKRQQRFKLISSADDETKQILRKHHQNHNSDDLSDFSEINELNKVINEELSDKTVENFINLVQKDSESEETDSVRQRSKRLKPKRLKSKKSKYDQIFTSDEDEVSIHSFSDDEPEPSKHRSKKREKNKIRKMKIPGKQEYYMQRLDHMLSEGDDFRRQRMETFMPKRYFWEPEDFQHLGYFWFNGDQGWRSPHHWGIGY